jgi:hypothetical protein
MGTDPLFFVDHKDNQYAAGIGVSWLFAKDWRLSPQITYLRNQSNIAIYEYDRTQVFVSVRKDF